MNGYALGLATVVLWAIYNVFARYVGLEGAHPAVFVCFGFMVASLMLLIVAGPGRCSLQAFREPVTWLYGLFSLLEHIFTVYLFIYVTSTEGSLLQRFGVVLSVALAWLFFHRRPGVQTSAGALMVVAGCSLLMAQIDAAILAPAFGFLVAAVLFQALKTFVIEAHPQIVAMRRIKEKVRVTAIISFVSSLIVFMALAGVAAYGAVFAVAVQPLPSAADFLRFETLLLGGVFGILIEPVSIYAYFYSVKLLNSERFMALVAGVPLVTYGLENTVGVFAQGMSIRAFTPLEWGSVLVITLGGLLMQVRRKPAKTI